MATMTIAGMNTGIRACEIIGPSIPSSQESALAEVSSQAFAAQLRSDRDMPLIVGEAEQAVRLPAQAAQMLLAILKQMAQGNPVAVVPFQPELTSQQAADFLNVSRPFLV